MPIKPHSLRGIHLDFKYHMPRKPYLLEWLRRLPGYDINALLLEYEDKFPWKKYPFLRDPDAFTPAELKEFLDTARGLGITVVPLVQTFSHLEFALNHPQLAHLRDTPDNHIKICASNPEALALVDDLIDEVLEWHGPDELFHLGGDEVWHTGWCPKCQQLVDRDGVIPMWSTHTNRFIDRVMSRGKRAIVWDDILWQDFSSIKTCGLRQGTILHAWNYNITSLTPKKAADSTDAEFGGAGGVLKQVAIYREAGFDSVSAPCINYGQLFSRHSISLKNTWVWAKKMREGNGLGVLNTSWAVFHVPLQSQNIYLAATGRLGLDADVDIGEGWQEKWLAGEFGCAATGVPQALETLGTLWEVPMPSYGRSFTPLTYCYMNMVLHYPGRQDERKRVGAYPLDWNGIDFNAMFAKGIAEIRNNPDMTPVYTRLDGILAEYPAAVAALEKLVASATKNRGEAEMLACFGALKLACARAVSHLLRNDGDGPALQRELEAIRPRLEKCLSDCYEPRGAARMMRAWWEPTHRALQAG